MSRSNKNYHMTEEELEHIRKELGERYEDFDPSPKIQSQVPVVEITESRIARKKDGVPQKYLKFKPLFLSKKMTTTHGLLKKERIQNGLIFYPLATTSKTEESHGDNLAEAVRNMMLVSTTVLIDWEPDTPELDGCEVTFAAIEKHEKKYWDDDLKNAYEDFVFGEDDFEDGKFKGIPS